jgi:hypothetical protein
LLLCIGSGIIIEIEKARISIINNNDGTQRERVSFLEKYANQRPFKSERELITQNIKKVISTCRVEERKKERRPAYLNII